MEPGPSLLQGSLWPSALRMAQPSVGAHHGPPSAGGEGAAPLKALANGNQDIAGGLSTKGHVISECLCLVATVMPGGEEAKSEGCSVGLALAGQPCWGLVAREQYLLQGLWGSKSSFHFVSTNCITPFFLCL